jgi:hypothetical protein
MPAFTELTRTECETLLNKYHVARLAYTFHDRVDVEPIGYVFSRGGLVFRTAPGSKFETLRHHPWVALEVDEVQDLFNWRSVVVHGTMYTLTDVGNGAEAASYHAAVKALRKVMPDALKPGDPTPFRSVVIRMECEQIVGRACNS